MISMYFVIGLGGALGAVCRALLTRLLPTVIFSIPIPILVVNVLGCFAIGILTEVFENYSPHNPYIKLFMVTGFLGGFTTFSAFSVDAGILMGRQHYFTALFYILLSVIMSISAFFCGLKVVKLFL